MGCIGYHRQYTKCQQPDLVWLQTLRPQDSVLVRTSVVLAQEVVGGSMPFKDEAVRKAKQKVYARKWYEGNRQEVIKRARKGRNKNRVEWVAYKSKQRCSHCRKKHPAIIDFHHVIKEGKRSVNYLAVRKRNIAEAIKEAEEKCIPLCSNCHRILHWDLTRKALRVRRKKRGDTPDIS